MGRGRRGCALVNQMRTLRRPPPSPHFPHLISFADAGADLSDAAGAAKEPPRPDALISQARLILSYVLTLLVEREAWRRRRAPIVPDSAI